MMVGRREYGVALLILAALGLAAILLATPHGIGASPDSVVYIAAARNLANGQGFTMLGLDGAYHRITHFMPLYSVVAAGSSLFGVDPYVGIRHLNAILFTGLILIIGSMVHWLFDRQGTSGGWLPVAAAAVLLASPAVMIVYLMAWSETLFILFLILGLWLLAIYLDGGKRSILILTAVVTALACMTRYAGLALVLSCAVAIIFLSRKKILTKIIDVTIFTLIGLGPVAVWILFNQISGGSATSRELGFHPISISHIQQAVTTLGRWVLIPTTMPSWVKLLPYGLLAIGFVAVFVKKRNPTQLGLEGRKGKIPDLIWTGFLFVLVYAVFLIASITFVDANTPLDERILAPVFPVGIILVFYLLISLAQLWSARPIKQSVSLGIGILATFAFLTLSTVQTMSLFQQSRAQGLRYAGPDWAIAPLLVELERKSPDLTIYSNNPEAITLYSPSVAFPLPKKFESANQRANPNFSDEMDVIRGRVIRGEAIVVYFNYAQRPALPSLEEMQVKYGFSPTWHAFNNSILTIPER